MESSGRPKYLLSQRSKRRHIRSKVSEILTKSLTEKTVRDSVNNSSDCINPAISEHEEAEETFVSNQPSLKEYFHSVSSPPSFECSIDGEQYQQPLLQSIRQWSVSNNITRSAVSGDSMAESI